MFSQASNIIHLFVTKETFMEANTVELRFLEPLRETKIGSRNWDVRNIEGKIIVKQIQGKRLLVRVIEVFEKSGVREIGVPL